MPQIKSAIKRVKTQENARERNIAQLNAMRTAVKKFKSASKGLIKKNKAGRDKSRLAALLNK